MIDKYYFSLSAEQNAKASHFLAIQPAKTESELGVLFQFLQVKF